MISKQDIEKALKLFTIEKLYPEQTLFISERAEEARRTHLAAIAWIAFNGKYGPRKEACELVSKLSSDNNALWQSYHMLADELNRIMDNNVVSDEDAWRAMMGLAPGGIKTGFTGSAPKDMDIALDNLKAAGYMIIK